MELARLAADLRADARQANERRLLVLAGDDGERGLNVACRMLAAAGFDGDGCTVLTARTGWVDEIDDSGWIEDAEHLAPERSGQLLGTTRDAIVLDAHTAFSPNALGRVAGAVDGGGLLVLVAPPLTVWPERRDAFDESLAAPPFDVEAVTGLFRRRLVDTVLDHDGIAVVDLDAGTIEREGLIDAGGEATRQRPASTPTIPPDRDRTFPRAAYETCLTADQSRALRAFERLTTPGNAVVLEADRGRGKSAAAGLAAGGLATLGHDVLVTAPTFQNAAEVFVRASRLLAETGALARDRDGPEGDHTLRTTAGGRVRFCDPPDARELPDDPDVVLVDEAAAIPVRLLVAFLDAPAVGFCTTVHGYEGTGRGFAVRFRDRLAASDRSVTNVHLREPIRYAQGDPIERWAFRALLLDASPPVAPLVEDATPETVTYRRLAPTDLVADEHLLRETFGLLVLAHYRTEPDDLARLLDAPNLSVRALCHDGHVVCVALLAREGGLSAETRRAAYEGRRIRGNMLPDVLVSQLRDEAAGAPVGYRIVRIATHHAVRSRGLGSELLAAVRDEVDRGDAPDDPHSTAKLDPVDWLGVGYGGTPRLLRFWARNGYRTIHLSTTRNHTSGEYSALMMSPITDAGRALADRHARWFRDRIGGVLSDPLEDLDPDVAREALRACDAPPAVDLSTHEWRVVAGAAYGPGLSDVAPDAFRRLAVAGLLSGEVDLTPEMERLLVRKALQARAWSTVADDLGYVSTSECMRRFGQAFQPLVDVFGDEGAHEERERYTE